MICQNCKKEIDDDSAFCNYCGIYLKKEGGAGKTDAGQGCCGICGKNIKLPSRLLKLSVALFYVITVVILILVLAGIFGIGRPKYKYGGFSGPDGYCDTCGKRLSAIDMLYQTTKRGEEFCRTHRGYNKYQLNDNGCSGLHPKNASTKRSGSHSSR